MKGFVLVTGASGFVGRLLCRELSQAGWTVRGLYLSSKLGPLLNDPSVEWLRSEPIGRDTDWSLLLAGGITHVVHLAALAHRVDPGTRPADSEYDEVNHHGTSRLAAQAAATSSIKRFVFVSSIGAVAGLADAPIDESTPCRPDTAYGASKLAGEVAVQQELSGATCEWCILRPPLMYGRGNPGNMERLLALMYLGLPLPLGSIRNRRSFLYVGNFVNAIERALSHPSASNRLFCVGDSEHLSTPALIRGLGHAAGRHVRLFPFPVAGLRLIGGIGSFWENVTGKSLRIDSASVAKLCGSLCINGARFRAECEWRPPYTLEEALYLTVGSTTC